MVEREAACDAGAERQTDNRSFLDAHRIEKVDRVLDVVVRLVIEVRFIGHAGADHVEGDTIEMPGMSGEIGGEVLEASSRAVQQDERRISRIAGLDETRL